MKPVLLFVLAFYWLPVFAQPTLTRATNAPGAGQAYTSTFAHVAGVTVGSPGANVTWDYSNLKDSAQGDTVRFVNASATPYASLFPQANLATMAKATDTSGGVAGTVNLYAYYLVNDNGLYSEGVFSHSSIGGSTMNDTSIYVPALRRYPLPITYLNQFTGSAQVINKTPLARDTSVEKDTVIADAWGTLKLPGKNYTNVLRVLTRSAVEVTIKIAGISFTTRVRSLSYSFYTPGYFGPLLALTVDTAGHVHNVSYSKGQVLPLQLLSFNAASQKSGVELTWSSAAEINTHVYQVQRSSTGNAFATIGGVPAKTGAAVNNYHYLDNSLPAGSSVLYYRLAEVDLDGSTHYSAIKPVLVAEAKALGMWPNPVVVNQPLHIRGNSLQQVNVFDVAGHLVKTVNLKGADSYDVNIQNLAKGTYLVTVHGGLGQAITNKIIVQ